MQMLIQYPSYPGHFLSYCQYKNGFRCNVCGQNGYGVGYRCAACDFDLHISCATANMAEPKVIQHPSHPGHWLRYVRYPSGYKCNGCGELVLESQNGYRCDACNFDLHECCATAPPVLDQTFHGGNGKWVHFQMEPPGGSQMRCSKCEQSVSGFGYYCISGSCRITGWLKEHTKL